MIYALLTFLLGAAALAAGLQFALANQERLPAFRRLPRAKLAGFLLGLAALVWSAREGCLMLEGDLARLHPIVWLLVPVTAILCWFHLDYLLARSLGGLFVFVVNTLLHEAFVHDTPCRPLYAAVALFWGILGLFLLGVPWRWRWLLERAAASRRLALSLSCAGYLSALVFWLLPLLGLLRR